MAVLKSIESIFNGSTLFRIPDYQRGYAWQVEHFDDLWQDILNVLPNMKRKHYTGALKVNRVSKNHAMNKWKEDKSFIEKSSDDALLHVIDGQQRLTTIVVLLWVILNDVEHKCEVFNGKTIKTLKEKYIHTEIVKGHPFSFYFGYENDDPSYEHLKQKIFEQDGDTGKLLETSYTKNLDAAKEFFLKKMKELDNKYETLANDVKEKIFRIITQNLKFELIDFSDEDIEISVIFETENNRGKKLTYLEILKNRLLYLTTLYTSRNENNEAELIIIRENLRLKITEAWQTIYLFLGLNKQNRLDDDDFLKAHWTMYCRYERAGKDPYANDIFKTVFVVKRVLDNTLKHTQIENYTTSLKQAVVEWYILNNPYHALSTILEQTDDENEFNSKILNLISIDKEEAFKLDKLNRLGFREFAPILLAARMKSIHEEDPTIDKTMRLRLIETIERYNFLLFPISHRKANLGEFYFQRLTQQLYHPENKSLVHGVVDDIWSFSQLIEDINLNWINRYLSFNTFADKIEELYLEIDRKTKTDINKKKGYVIWYGLEYLLQEYEMSLQAVDIQSQHKFGKRIERIYMEDCFDKNYRYNPSYSLGNLFLTNRKLPINFPVDVRKEKLEAGTKMEQEFAEMIDKYSSIDTIKERGLKLLTFIEQRWNVLIEDDIKEKLLFLKMK